MIVNVCYNDSCIEFLNKVKELCNNDEIKFNAYDESHYKEKKKAYKIKGGYSARMTPFVLITDNDNKYIQAFYTENNDCTVDKICNFLNSYYGKRS